MEADDGPTDDLTDLNEALHGATIDQLEWKGPYGDRDAGDAAGASPRHLELLVRLLDGRLFALHLGCFLTDAATRVHLAERRAHPIGDECLRWESLDPGLQLVATLYNRTDQRIPEGEDDPLAEAESPLWTGQPARRVADLTARARKTLSQMVNTIEDVEVRLGSLRETLEDSL